MEDKNGTGPKLMGVKAKWESAKEGDFIYDWVNNSAQLIASGKSKMALEIKGYSPTEMPVQSITKEEIDAIFAYVDSYTPPQVAEVSTGTNTEKAVVKIVPNYTKNLNIFYGLLGLSIVLIIAIVVLSGSIINLVKSDFFKNKSGDGTSFLSIILLITSLGIIGNSSQIMAFNFMSYGEASEKMPWVLIENSDIYTLLTINLVLLCVLIYLRTIFNRLMATVRPEKIDEDYSQAKVFQKINLVLTDTVPIEKEHEILMEHEYDGIRELDNNLPPWWIWGFYFTIIVGFIYLINYHVVGYSDLQIKAYDKDMIKSNKEVKAYLSAKAMNVDETNVTMLTSKSDLALGKEVYGTQCITCHKENGEGDVGPNITDKNWIYGFDIKDIFLTIKSGRPNGMPEHASKLNPVQIQQVASYVLSLPYVKGTKPAQGDILEK